MDSFEEMHFCTCKCGYDGLLVRKCFPNDYGNGL